VQVNNIDDTCGTRTYRASDGEALASSQEHPISFFKKITQRLQSRRLGDLLVSDGLISPEQLELALSLQNNARKQLGRILIDQNAISAFQLYKKLTEQWCMRAAITGVTFFISFSSLSSTTARAAQNQPELILASSMNLQSLDRQKGGVTRYPRLFNTGETRSDNISAFSKWTGMMKRFEAQLKSRNAPKEIRAINISLNQSSNKTTKEQIIAVNDLMNNQRYISDNRNWNKSDYWATPVEFFQRGGDCEDYAIAKYAALKALGIPHNNMRIAIVDDLQKGIKHAILIVYTNDGAYVLDNQDKRVRNIKDVKRYKPIFSINRNSWWLHNS